MNTLQNSKIYTGKELERTFFVPMLMGPSAQDLGIRIVYNMPMPTLVQVYQGHTECLRKYTTSGWKGVKANNKRSVEIPMGRVKAETAYSASDYFSTIYENLLSRPGVDMENLSGTELEEVETQLFKQDLKESIRTTMWLGDTNLSAGYNTFNGFLKEIFADKVEGNFPVYDITPEDMKDANRIPVIFDNLWADSTEEVKSLKNSGQLVYFVTSDIYDLYEKYLDSKGVDAAYTGMTEGRKTLYYHGIQVVDLQLSAYSFPSTFKRTFAILSFRDNFVLAVNTADMPENEVRMWYNPDEMENRQRVCFMAGCKVLDTTLLTMAVPA